MRAALADTEIVEPKGEYAKIDVKQLNETLKILSKGSAKEKKKAVEQVKKSPEKYAPPVFYALSKVLFDDGKRGDAAFWFYAGQLRARFDANRCADVSARQSKGKPLPAIVAAGLVTSPTFWRWSVTFDGRSRSIVDRKMSSAGRFVTYVFKAALTGAAGSCLIPPKARWPHGGQVS